MHYRLYQNTCNTSTARKVFLKVMVTQLVHTFYKRAEQMQRDGVVFGQLRAGFQFPAGAEIVCILPLCPDWLGGPYSLLSEGHRRPHWQGYVSHSMKLTRGILLESKDTYSFASTLPRHLSNVVARLGRPTGVTWISLTHYLHIYRK
jgi:hypothetical protein